MDDQLVEVDPNTCPEQLLCTEEEVLFLLTCLDVTKASGPDDISARILKATAAAIIQVMTKLFNLSISTGSIHQAAKSSVVPVSKSTDHTLQSNYRPISLFSILSKVLEKYISCYGRMQLSSHSTSLKASMMYRFVHGDGYIPEDVLLLRLPPTITYVIVLISLFPVLEQMFITIRSSHMLHFWNSFPPTVAHAPSSLVFKRLSEFCV